MIPVTAATRLFAVLGRPVRHSLSPVMQTEAFEAAGIDARYLAFEVEPERLDAALAGAAAMGFGGLNVTLPLKERALLLADSLDETAELIGAANTLVAQGGGWRAFNTDAAGFARAVAEGVGYSPSRNRAAILGAGGAARAAIVGLFFAGTRDFSITSRTIESARRLSADLGPRLPGARLEVVALEALPEAVVAGDLVASLTPLGLDPAGRWPWELTRFGAGTLFFDSAYGSRGTPLEGAAREAGFRSASGLRMLLYQGAEAFRLWTGRDAPVQAMEAALNAVGRR